MTDVAIIIVNFNGADDTIDCLKSIKESASMPAKQGVKISDAKIIIVDNNSSENDLYKLSKWISRSEISSNIKLIKLLENSGFSGGNNVGIKMALQINCNYVLLLNNDTIIETDFLHYLIKTAESDSKIGIVGPKIYFAKGYEYHKEQYKKNDLGKVLWYAGGKIDWQNMYASHRGLDEIDKGQYDKAEKTDFISGCCMLIKSELFHIIGCLDEELYLYLEDLDFCLRTRQAGFKLIYEPSSSIWHKNASSSGKPGSKLHQYYQTRNRLIIGMRYAPLRTRLALLKESLSMLKHSRIRKKAVLDFYLYKFGKSDL